MTVLPRRSFNATSFPFSSGKVKSGALSWMFMRILPAKSKSSRANPATAASSKVVVQRILYCGWLALLASVMGLAVAATAQEERPQITPGERKVPRKKEAGPRALAVLQLSANGKASLVPIAILVNGKFWDAGAYKANPVPMALEPGTVYEGYRTGSSQGLFTIGSALHSNSANAPVPWVGTGNWMPAGTEIATKTHAAESVPVGIDNSDAPPRLTKNPAPPASVNPPSTAAPSTPSQPSGSSGSGDEPPRLTKPAASPSTPSAAPADSSSPAQTSSAPAGAADAKSSAKSSDGKSGDAKPSTDKSSDSKPDERANVPASDSGASEANRPRLRRGKPAESFADEDVPGYSKPGAALPVSAANATKAVATPSDKGPITLIPAISDATSSATHSYAFEWLKDEEGERKQQMITYAREQVRAYVNARAQAQITPPPTGPASARRKQATKVPEPILENVQMIAYDLWTTNHPIMVFAADAHMPPPAGTAHATADPGLEYTIMLVAHTDIYNNLQKLFLAVTDKNHLDVTPRLELIDAVDADGDGRGELLFRETSDAGTGWIIYRASGDKLWKMFDSLNPE